MFQNFMHAPHRATVIAVIIALGACARPTSVSSTWQEIRQSPAHPYDKILVVGISDDSNQRRRFENLMLGRLQKPGTTVWASHQSMQPDRDLNRATVTALVKQTGATAVIVTRLADQKISTEEVDARTGHKTRRKGENPVNFFRYDYDEYEEPAYLVVKNTVSLITDLYETKEGRLLYSIETTTHDKESGMEIIDEATSAIVARLRRDGLIP